MGNNSYKNWKVIGFLTYPFYNTKVSFKVKGSSDWVNGDYDSGSDLWISNMKKYHSYEFSHWRYQ